MIVLLDINPLQKAELADLMDDLIRGTQALPQIQTITEEEITAEIAAYRAEQRENSDC